MKNVYVFEDVAEVSGSYHNNGGLVIIASCKENVEDLITQEEGGYIKLTKEDWENVKIYPLDKDLKTESRIFVFRDAGCC